MTSMDNTATESFDNECALKKYNHMIDLHSTEMFPTLKPLTTSSSGNNTTDLKPNWGANKGTPVASSLKKPAITQVFQMPIEQQRKNRDDKSSLAEICAIIGEESKTLINASRSGRTNDLTFVIKGEEADINTARRQIWSKLAEITTIALDVPEAYLGLVIGPGGRIIQSLMVESFTKINVPKKYEGNILVTGDFEGISLAKGRIEALIHDKVSKSSEAITCARYLLSFIFASPHSGMINDRISDFTRQYEGLKISVSLGKLSLLDEPATIMLSGDRKLVEKVSLALRQKIETLQESIKNVSTKVPKALHRLIIGPKAETLHALEEITKCIIWIPTADDSSCTIFVYGREGDLLKGLQAVLEKTAALDSQVIMLNTKGITKELVPIIINKIKSLIKELENKYGVHVHLTEDEITVDGKKAEVAVALMELESVIKQMQNLAIDSMVVENGHIKHIIGRKGHNLEQIKNEFNVDFNIPDVNNAKGNQTTIIITAVSKGSIEKAKEHLAGLVKSLDDIKTVILEVDSKFHGALIGHKGSNIKKYHEKYPEVTIDFEESKIYLRGPPTELASASKSLSAEAEGIKHNAILRSYTSEIALANKEQLKSAALDQNGKNISRSLLLFAKDHDVKLELEGVNNDTLVIRGLKASVEVCKPLLEKRLKEIADTDKENIEIPHKFHSMVIGKGGKNVKHLSQKYSIRMAFPSLEDVENDLIVITGPRTNLKAAKEEIYEFFEYERSRRNVENILVPKSAVPLITGKSGKTIDAIIEETDTKINIEKSNKEMVTVTIEGSIDGIAKAKCHIDKLVEESKTLGAELIAVSAKVFEQLSNIGAFALRNIVSKYDNQNVTIVLSASKNDILIKGKLELVEQAVKDINNLISTLSEYVQVKVKIPVRYHFDIIGNRGENISRLRQKLAVNIVIPRDRDDDEVTIEGRQENVNETVEELLKYVKESKLVKISHPFRAEVINDTAAELEKLGLKHQNHRDGILLLGGNSILLEQGAECINKALMAIQKTKSIEVLEIPHRFHGLLIGKQGAQVEALRQQTGCHIHIPRSQTNSDQVELSGTPESISKAKLAIQEIISQSA